MGKFAEIRPGDRIERIVDLIASGRAQTAGQLAGQLGVDRRTIRRDVNALKKGNIRIHYNRREEKYEFLEPVIKISKFILTGEDAVTAALIASTVLQDFRYTPLAGEIQKLIRNLTSNLPEMIARYQLSPKKYSFVHSQMAGVDPGVWKIVVHALNMNHRLRIRYGAPGAPPPSASSSPSTFGATRAGGTSSPTAS